MADQPLAGPPADQPPAPASDTGATTPSGNPIIDALTAVLPQALGKAKLAISPYPFGISDDDNLRLTFLNRGQASIIQVNYRVLRRDGSTQAGSYQFSTFLFDPLAGVRPLGGGWITNLEVFYNGGQVASDAAFVKLELVRGLSGSILPIGVMIQGVITGNNALSWPGSPLLNSLDGPPMMEYANLGVLPAGLDWAYQPADSFRRELQAITFTFTTSAAAGNRQILLTVNGPPGVNLWQIALNNAPFGPGVFAVFNIGAGGALDTTGVISRFHNVVPVGFTLEPGARIGSFSSGLDAADQFSAVVITSKILLRV